MEVRWGGKVRRTPRLDPVACRHRQAGGGARRPPQPGRSSGPPWHRGRLLSPPEDPVSRHLASKWLVAVEELTGLERTKGSRWQAYRRKWATERKHLPDVDVAAAGGGASQEALNRSYQQADQDTMLQVVLGAGQLRERA